MKGIQRVQEAELLDWFNVPMWKAVTGGIT
jgi:hypothetical protein